MPKTASSSPVHDFGKNGEQNTSPWKGKNQQAGDIHGEVFQMFLDEGSFLLRPLFVGIPLLHQKRQEPGDLLGFFEKQPLMLQEKLFKKVTDHWIKPFCRIGPE